MKDEQASNTDSAVATAFSPAKVGAKVWVIIAVASCISVGTSIYSIKKVRNWMLETSELEYVVAMRGKMLGEYQERHGRWPKTIEEMEQDFESANCPSGKCGGDYQSWVDIYRRYRPKMTVLDQDKDYFLARVDFTQGYPGTFTVRGD